MGPWRASSISWLWKALQQKNTPSKLFSLAVCNISWYAFAVASRPQLNLQLPRFRRTGSRRSKAGSPSPSDFGGNYSIASSGDVPISLTSTQRGGETVPLDTFSNFNPNMLSVSAQQFPPGSRRASTTPSVRSTREPSVGRTGAAERQENFSSSRENTQSPVITHSTSGQLSIGGTSVPG